MRSYFPNDKWYDVDLNQVTHDYGDGKFIDLPATWDYINTHMRGGTIVTFLDPAGNTTDDLLNSKMTLRILRDSAGFAAGNVFVDDGKTSSSISDGNYKYYRFIFSGSALTVNKISGGTGEATINQNEFIESIIILDAEDLKETAFQCALGNDLTIY